MRSLGANRKQILKHILECATLDWIYLVLVGKPEGWRPLGKSRSRWKHEIRTDLETITRAWTGLIWLRIGKSLKFVITFMNSRVRVP